MERWLAEISAPLADAAAEEGPARERLLRWLDLLVESKQSRAREDPELFATYTELAANAREVIGAHVGAHRPARADHRLRVSQGEFDVANPETAARAVFDATSRFHNPANAPAWADPEIKQAYAAVRSLVLAGLTKTTAAPRTEA